MSREFDKNMFIMLLAIMIGVIIITYFAADIVKKAEIENISKEITSELNIKHSAEIKDISSDYENFTDYFLQGFTKINSAREIRSEGNYYFDFALFWYNNVLTGTNDSHVEKCIENCLDASNKYLLSNQRFAESRPYIVKAKNYTNDSSYLGLVDYFISFTRSGENITNLRYEASLFLMHAVENHSAGNLENAALLMENFTIYEDMYNEQLSDYNTLENLIDDFVFFEEDRTKPGG